MLIVRPTKDLAKRMGVKLTSSDESSSTRLGDWYANDLVIDRKQYIFCVSQNGRLFVLLKAAPYKDFHTRISEALFPLLQSLGIERDKVSHETSQMSPITLAKTADRSIVSTMNEYKYELEIWGKMGRFDHGNLLSTSLKMADRLSLTLKEGTPRDSIIQLFSPKLKLVF